MSRAQLAGHDHLRCEALVSEQLAYESDGRALITPALNQHIHDLALVIKPHATGTFFCRQSPPHMARASSLGRWPKVARPPLTPLHSGWRTFKSASSEKTPGRPRS